MTYCGIDLVNVLNHFDNATLAHIKNKRLAVTINTKKFTLKVG